MKIPIVFAVEFPDDLIELIARLNRQNAEIIRRLGQIENAVRTNTANNTLNLEALMADFTALTAEVEANGDAVDSAITVLNALATQIANAADDPAEIMAIAEQLAGNSTRLAEAVAANTPAAPEPTPG